MSLTPKKIYEEVKSKHSAVDLLISIIDNSRNIDYRVESIGYLDKIGLMNQEIYQFLKNLLISDRYKEVRIAAAIVIHNRFLYKALSPMMYAILNEPSLKCLGVIKNSIASIIDLLVEMDTEASRDALIKEVSRITDINYRDNLHTLLSTNQIKQFINKELAQILIDYITISLFKKQFQQLRFELERGVVVKLDLRLRYLNVASELISSQSPLVIPKLVGNESIFQQDSIKPLSFLKELSLNYNNLKEIPKWILTLNNLNSLVLHGNQIDKLPNWIGRLTELSYLGISGNKISVLPESLIKLTKLKYLNLNGNNFKWLPEWLSSLSKLEILRLDNNKLFALPKSLARLSSLKILSLGKNNFKNLSTLFDSMPKLKFLWLEGNKIEILPKSFCSLGSLEHLYLNNNMLSSLPDSMDTLSSLKVLQLNNNILKEIPESIGTLINLKELWLKNNDIKKIPDSVKELEMKGLSIYL